MRDGWRVLMRAPGVVISEIIWRWTFGIAFWALLFFSFHNYLSSIEISQSEYALMKALAPFTWMAITVRVMAAIVQGFRDMSPILFPALCLLWVALASLGRVASVRALASGDPRTHWPSVVGLSLFRLAMLFATLVAYFGTGALVSGTFDPQLHFGLNFFLMFLVLLVLSGIWSIVNWFFSVAAIFAARDGAGVWTSLRGAADLYQMRAGRTGVWFSLIRSGLVIASTLLSLILFSALLQGIRLLPLFGIVFVTLIYFAAVDGLYMWRLATYIGLTEPEPEPPTPLPSELPAEPMVDNQSEPSPETHNEDLWTPPPPLTEELKTEN
jgi:hypothetical protein